MTIRKFSLLAVLFCISTAFTSNPNTLNANFYVKGQMDSNGYIHMKLPWNGEFLPRFTIGIEADQSPVRYNGSSVVTAKASSDASWDGGVYGVIDVVQSTTLYLSPDKNGKAYSKRIVGPIPPQMKGDTLLVNMEIVWDLGKSEEKKNFLLKFIVE